MDKFVFVKEGDYKQNIFNNLMETVNSETDGTDFDQQVGAYTRIDYSFRFGRNRSNTNPEIPFAVFHFETNPVEENQPDSLFRPVDTEKMMRAVDEGYRFVLLGYYSDSHLLPDFSIIKDSRYIVRDEDGILIDYDTKEPIAASNPTSVAFVTVLVGMVKFSPLDVYYLVMDPYLVKITDGLDYTDEDKHIVYHLTNDGTVKDNFFDPTFSNNVTKVGENILLVEGDSFTIDMVGKSLINQYGRANVDLPDLPADITANCSYTRSGNILTVTPPPVAGYVKYEFKGGSFFDMIQQQERLIYEFAVIKT